MNRQTDGKYVVIHTRRGQAMPLMGCKIHSSVSTRTVNTSSTYLRMGAFVIS